MQLTIFVQSFFLICCCLCLSKTLKFWAGFATLILVAHFTPTNVPGLHPDTLCHIHVLGVAAHPPYSNVFISYQIYFYFPLNKHCPPIFFIMSLQMENRICLIMCSECRLHFSSRFCFITKQEIWFFACVDIVSYFLLLLLVRDWPSMR